MSSRNIYLYGVRGKEGNGKMRICVDTLHEQNPDHGNVVVFYFELCCCPIEDNLGRSFLESSDLSGGFKVRGIENICLAFKQVYDALKKPEDLLYPPEMIKDVAEWNADWW